MIELIVLLAAAVALFFFLWINSLKSLVKAKERYNRAEQALKIINDAHRRTEELIKQQAEELEKQNQRIRQRRYFK